LRSHNEAATTGVSIFTPWIDSGDVGRCPGGGEADRVFAELAVDAVGRTVDIDELVGPACFIVNIVLAAPDALNIVLGEPDEQRPA
jgi:hypothetical protein